MRDDARRFALSCLLLLALIVLNAWWFGYMLRGVVR